MDRSNGYETISKEFLAHRSKGSIGVIEVTNWARTLPHGSTVIDLGCGPGLPITAVLVQEKLHVFGVDASPSLVAAFRQNLPGTPILCESVLESHLFSRIFDSVLSIGLMFLLQTDEQQHLIRRFAEILEPGGHLLFTSPAKPGTWNDAMTGLESVSLGAERYRKSLADVGISVVNEYEDIGQNHYFEAIRR